MSFSYYNNHYEKLRLSSIYEQHVLDEDATTETLLSSYTSIRDEIDDYNECDSKESCIDNDDKYLDDYETDNSPTSTLTWNPTGEHKCKTKEHSLAYKSVNRTDRHIGISCLQARKRNEHMHRAMKMSAKKCPLHEDPYTAASLDLKMATSGAGLFDDISYDSLQSGNSSTYTATRESVTNSLMAYLLQMNKEKQKSLDESTDCEKKPADEEMLRQLSECEIHPQQQELEERLTRFEILTPCFLAFTLVSIVLGLILFTVPWKKEGMPSNLPSMPSVAPSEMPVAISIDIATNVSIDFATNEIEFDKRESSFVVQQ